MRLSGWRVSVLDVNCSFECAVCWGDGPRREDHEAGKTSQEKPAPQANGANPGRARGARLRRFSPFVDVALVVSFAFSRIAENFCRVGDLREREVHDIVGVGSARPVGLFQDLICRINVFRRCVGRDPEFGVQLVVRAAGRRDIRSKHETPIRLRLRRLPAGQAVRLIL